MPFSPPHERRVSQRCATKRSSSFARARRRSKRSNVCFTISRFPSRKDRARTRVCNFYPAVIANTVSRDEGAWPIDGTFGTDEHPLRYERCEFVLRTCCTSPEHSWPRSSHGNCGAGGSTVWTYHPSVNAGSPNNVTRMSRIEVPRNRRNLGTLQVLHRHSPCAHVIDFSRT